MGRQTRSGYRETTPVNQIEPHEADTIKKTRFYRLFDQKPTNQGLRAFSRLHHFAESTTRRWIHQRSILGTPAYRRTRTLSTRLGPPLRATEAQIRMLLDDQTNPVRDEPLSVQISHHSLNIKERQLQNRLITIDKSRLYKAAFVKDDLTDRVKALRVSYAQKHLPDTIESYWKWVVFTDEFHLDPSAQRPPRILRPQGTRYELQNIAIRPPKTGVILHCAGWVNWHEKCEILEFYNDKVVEQVREHAQKVAIKAVQEERLSRPRRRPTTESEAEYQERLQQWEALPKPPQIKTKYTGNSMTQIYYTDRLLPVYITAIQKLQTLYNHPFYLQEDGDPSHGIKKRGPAQNARDKALIITHLHPSFSPDMNPIEAAWNILKQRLRQIQGLQSMEIDELKETVQKVWKSITIEEIRERIEDLPNRCSILVQNGGLRIKGEKW